jgi:quinol-cytochrome oxidoreductase complex cytochrome b subunit
MSALPPVEIVESTDPISVPRRVALVRPDRRASVRTREETWLMTFPHLILREVILLQLVLLFLAVAAMLFDAPLEGIANPLETPNPAKAPWYFLGLQELLHYFPPVVAGVLIPTLVVLALVVIPYAKINLGASPLWESADASRLAVAVAGGALLLMAVFAWFGCWAIVIPTGAIAAAMFAARGGASGGRGRRMLARVTLPEWIMTWFVAIATILTVLGTFFRGPGWSLVWPWSGAALG